MEEQKDQPEKPKSRRGSNLAGRPKGVKNKLTATTLLETIHRQSGKEFHELLTESYLETIKNKNTGLRLQYEKLILNKVMCDPKPDPADDQPETMANKTTAELIEIAASLMKKLG